MASRRSVRTVWILATMLLITAMSLSAQSFRVQCPTSTITHPSNLTNVNAEPSYNGPTTFTTAAVNGAQGGYMVPSGNVNGAIKCQQISGGDGYSTMADGVQEFMFSFGPLSGLADIAAGKPGTQVPNVFNVPWPGGGAVPLLPGDPATTDGASGGGSYNGGIWPNPPFIWNGAVGLVPDIYTENIETNPSCTAGNPANPACIDGHVDPRQIMDVGVMNGNIPAPLIAFDEDDEFFLTLTNVGMIMRPDLFEQHTVHFHGYPNASSFYDGVPDASVAINIGGSFTYYYLAPDAGTYFWHCHITPPEHLQMGMVGQLYVRPRQNRVVAGLSLYKALQMQNGQVAGQAIDLRTACNPSQDILCSAVTPPADPGVPRVATGTLCAGNAAPMNFLNNGPLPQSNYVYNDGDGSTCYDVERPLQIHGFDPNFHFIGMTFNPEMFADMKDKYFLLNGRSYPDTVTQAPQATQTTDGKMHYSQPLHSVINIPAGGKAALRIADLDVSEYQTLASLGIPMKVVGWNAKLLRDQAGNNTEYYTNSITLGGGESCDVILDASNTTLYPSGSVFYLFTTNLDHLSNDAENFGGLMTEVHIL